MLQLHFPGINEPEMDNGNPQWLVVMDVAWYSYHKELGVKR